MPASAQLLAEPTTLRRQSPGIDRQYLSRQLFGWEQEFVRGARNKASTTSAEIEGNLEALTDTGAKVVAFVREFEERFAGTLAGDTIIISDLAERIAEVLTDGLTGDAARVLTAAVKRDLT